MWVTGSAPKVTQADEDTSDSVKEKEPQWSRQVLHRDPKFSGGTGEPMPETHRLCLLQSYNL